VAWQFKKELRHRFITLRIPLRIGSQDLMEARSEVDVLRAWFIGTTEESEDIMMILSNAMKDGILSSHQFHPIDHHNSGEKQKRQAFSPKNPCLSLLNGV
jgi:hypothetical protein